MHLFTGSSVHSCTSPCMQEYKGQPVEILNRIKCSNLSHQCYMGKTHPAIVLALHFHTTPSIHPPCTVLLWHDSSLLLLTAAPSASRSGKFRKCCWVSMTSLKELHTPAQRAPVSQSPEQLPSPSSYRAMQHTNHQVAPLCSSHYHRHPSPAQAPAFMCCNAV